jgi:hypothetical protein
MRKILCFEPFVFDSESVDQKSSLISAATICSVFGTKRILATQPCRPRTGAERAGLVQREPIVERTLA